MAKRVLYLGGGREIGETLEKAKGLGLSVTYIQHKDQFKDNLLPYFDQAALVNYEDPSVLIPVARALHGIQACDAALSMSEDALVPAARVREALRLGGGNSLQTVTLLKDKARMRKWLNARGCSPVLSRVGANLRDLEDFGREAGFPFVVKPLDGAGKHGVLRALAADGLTALHRDIQDLKLDTFLMEEFLDGVEVSVETFSFGGRHVVLSVTDKMTLPNFVEVGHWIPSRLDPRSQEALADGTRAFLDCIGFTDGAAHTELKLTSKGVRIIESHDRPAGGRISEMVRVAYGVDMKRLTLGWACGLVEPLAATPALQRAVAIRFLPFAPGTVTAIEGQAEIEAAEGFHELRVRAQVGDTLTPIRENHDLVAYVIATGDDVDQANQRCEAMGAMLRIRTA